MVFRVEYPLMEGRAYVLTSDPLNAKSYQKSFSLKLKEENVLTNGHISLKFDSNGNLYEVGNLDSNITSQINQRFCFYQSVVGKLPFQRFNAIINAINVEKYILLGNNSQDIFQASGAYIFRPQSNTPTCLTAKNFTIYASDLFDEIHQVYNDWISQTIRVYKDDSKSAEFEWQVGPIDVSDGVGKEIIMKFNSDLKTEALFYTDSNGREMLERRRDYRPTWRLNQTENVA